MRKIVNLVGYHTINNSREYTVSSTHVWAYEYASVPKDGASLSVGKLRSRGVAGKAAAFQRPGIQTSKKISAITMYYEVLDDLL
jgi:hypothetical protein